MVNKSDSPRFTNVYGSPISDAMNFMEIIFPTLSIFIIFRIIFITNKSSFRRVANPMKIGRGTKPNSEFKNGARSP
jgi:hypothetical protein